MSIASAVRLSLAFVLLMWLQPVHAQVESREGIALQNQILELRQTLRIRRHHPRLVDHQHPHLVARLQ